MAKKNGRSGEAEILQKILESLQDHTSQFVQLRAEMREGFARLEARDELTGMAMRDLRDRTTKLEEKS